MAEARKPVWRQGMGQGVADGVSNRSNLKAFGCTLRHMLERIYNLEEKRRLVNYALDRARSFLDRKSGPIETSRSLSRFNLRGHDESLDVIIETFDVVDSETEDLPVGEVRELWNADALKREDVRIARAEQLYRDCITEACLELVALLGPLQAELQDQHPPEST